MIQRANLVAGDGGGPPRGIRGPSQRVAAGLALVLARDCLVEEIAFGFFPVEGRQTVPRAELSAPVILTDVGDTQDILSDNTIVVMGATKHMANIIQARKNNAEEQHRPQSRPSPGGLVAYLVVSTPQGGASRRGTGRGAAPTGGPQR